ncbi:MAG: Spy/CpxP family protein refolding chaperone [Candidatus Omnitrophica bacterium]|nr:Spy/CpxP family protein refolding chaperone [Candidatus Omnitrophota bacterium]
MGKMQRVLVSIAVVGLLGFSSMVYAQTAGDLTEDEMAVIKQRRLHKASMQAKLQEELGLTDEQVQQLDQQRNQHRGEINQSRQKMQELRQEMKTETEKTQIDEAKIRAVHEQMKSVQNKIADQRLEGILQLRKILTPEQFKKFHESRGKGRGKMGKMQQGRGMGQGREGHGMGQGCGIMDDGQGMMNEDSGMGEGPDRYQDEEID